MTQADCGALIRALREQAQITRAELAESLLRDPEEIAAIEMGHRAVTQSDSRALARVFALAPASIRMLSENPDAETLRAA